MISQVGFWFKMDIETVGRQGTAARLATIANVILVSRQTNAYRDGFQFFPDTAFQPGKSTSLNPGQNAPVLVTDFSITLPAVAETIVSNEAMVPGVPESEIVVVVSPAATFACPVSTTPFGRVARTVIETFG